jgi:hypothetical protein
MAPGLFYVFYRSTMTCVHCNRIIQSSFAAPQSATCPSPSDPVYSWQPVCHVLNPNGAITLKVGIVAPCTEETEARGAFAHTASEWRDRGMDRAEL